MPVPRPVARALLVVLLLVGAVFAAVGGLALRAPGMIAVGVAGLLAGLTAAAIAHDAPRPTLRTTVEAAALATAGTVGALLVVSGTSALLGGPITVGVLAATVLVVLLRSGRRAGPPAEDGHAQRRQVMQVLPVPVATEEGDGGPVSGLTTAALGREWLRTTAALATGVDAAARSAIVARREATLDELERRDPVGFGRWLSDGPLPGSDPSAYVRGGPVPGAEAA